MDLGAVHAVQYKLGLAEIFLFPFPIYFVYKLLYCKYIVNPSRPLVSFLAALKWWPPTRFYLPIDCFEIHVVKFGIYSELFFLIPVFFT